MTDTIATLWKSGREEEVEVDQQALIDKILARYAGEFTVFRELLQNSDDASAKTAEIHFQTQTHLDIGTQTPPTAFPDLKTQPFVQWVFGHDGIPFKSEDWDRLKKIADGNPDEQKIGAFGVGFYSVFSITDEPFVKSGQQWMGFYWKENQNQLIARRGQLPCAMVNRRSGSPWTAFEMPLREAAPFSGNYLDFIRFLATSLTFVKHIKDVSVFIDDHRVARIQKGVERPQRLTIPKYFNRKTPQKMMEVKEVHTNKFYMTARVMSWILQSKGEKELPTELGSTRSDPLDAIVSSIDLTIYSAQADVRLGKVMTQELLRATKKKMPPTCTYSLIYIEKDDTSDKKNSVFQDLRADLSAKGTARVFIGHATSQSTGLGGHVSARFIPTVERESVDLVDQHVSKWNKDLLYVGGLLARFVYDMEISQIRDSWEQATKEFGPDSSMDEADAQQLDDRSTRILQFFSFYPTTPSQVVGKELEAAFFSCAQDQTFLVMSTTGVQPAHVVRFYNASIKPFTRNLSMISYNATQGTATLMKVLRARGMLQDASIQDVLNELSKGPLTEKEMVKCLEWRIALEAREISYSDKVLLRQRFLQKTTFYLTRDGISEGEALAELSTFKTFMSSTNAVPRTCPLPPHTLPFSISKHFQPNKLRSVFGWNDLGLLDWVTHLVNPSTLNSLGENVTTSAIFAEEVLNIIASTWATLPGAEKTRLRILLKDQTVVPTTSGLMKPGESYFHFVDLFKDLPTVRLSSGVCIENDLEDLLSFLGVMKYVEMKVVISRMMFTGHWNTMDLMDYIVKYKNRLSQVEIQSLRPMAAFLQEQRPGLASSLSQGRLLLSELHEPSDTFRELGLPVLDWRADAWRRSSEEATLLFNLGLRKYPELSTILESMASTEEKVRKVARDYFLGQFNLYSAKYNPKDFGHLAYIPAVKPDGTRFMSKPYEVYVDSECAVMGFSVVDPQLRNVALSKLSIQNHPSTQSIMNILLETPPTKAELAQKYFEYLASRSGDFSETDYGTLRQACIMPATPPIGLLNHERPSPFMAKPGECIFKGYSSSKIHSKLFVSVDFGSKANIFLKACGVKDRPELRDIIAILLQDPKHFLEIAGSTNEYLEQLRHIAAYEKFSPDIVERMRTSSFLLGQVRSPSHSEIEGSSVGAKDDNVIFKLLQPSQIAVVDDINAYSLFSDCIHVAPEEETLETFYLLLGSARLTTLIAEECEACEVDTSDSPLAAELRCLVLERSPLFLHEQSTRAKVEVEWLAQTENFMVRYCDQLKLKRILTFQGKVIPKIQSVSARTVAANGGITLLLSKSGELDMYEVANSMCKVLLKDARPDDSLIFMTILSTNLHALCQRGYSVDKILHQQKLPVLQDATPLKKEPKVSNGVLPTPVRDPNNRPRSRDPDAAVPPITGIDSTFWFLFDDCFPENKEARAMWGQITMLGRDIGESYCNVELGESYMESQVLVEVISGYQLFVPRDASDLRDIQTHKRGVIDRFVTTIMNPLLAIFNIPMTTLNILYDPSRVIVAFNRGGQIFLSLRFYEQWHDEDVESGRTKEVLTMWYYALAHQIAHNSSGLHNSDHAFHFASACKRHFLQFLELLCTYD